VEQAPTADVMDPPETAAGEAGAPRNRWAMGLLGGSALLALAFEQSPANEALRTALGLSVLDWTSNALAVGLAVLAITFVIELVSSVLIVAGLRGEFGSFSRLVDRARTKATDGTANPSSRLGSVLTDVGIALGLGAGLVVVRHHLRTREPGLRNDLLVAIKASGVVAVVSGLIGLLAAGGIEHADAVGLGREAELFVQYATDWRFWFGVLLLVQGIPFLRRQWAKRRRDAPPAA